MNPGKRSKQRGQDFSWKVHDRTHHLFLTHILHIHELRSRNVSVGSYWLVA